ARLESLFRARSESPRAWARRNPFGVAVAVSPNALRAEAVPATRLTRYGPITHVVLRYRSRGFARSVLLHVWPEPATARAALVEWLDELGRVDDRRVRVCAATAVGLIACESFESIARRIVIPWAEDPHQLTRLSAAISLGLPASDPDVGDAVRALVK